MSTRIAYYWMPDPGDTLNKKADGSRWKPGWYQAAINGRWLKGEPVHGTEKGSAICDTITLNCDADIRMNKNGTITMPSTIVLTHPTSGKGPHIQENRILRWNPGTTNEILPEVQTPYVPGGDDWLNHGPVDSKPTTPRQSRGKTTYNPKTPQPACQGRPATVPSPPEPHPYSYLHSFIRAVFPHLIHRYFTVHKDLCPAPENLQDNSDDKPSIHVLWSAIVALAAPHLREHLDPHMTTEPTSVGADDNGLRLVTAITSALPHLHLPAQSSATPPGPGHADLYHALTGVLDPYYPMTSLGDTEFILTELHQCASTSCDYERASDLSKNRISISTRGQYDNNVTISQLLGPRPHHPDHDPPQSDCPGCDKPTLVTTSASLSSPPPRYVLVELNHPIPKPGDQEEYTVLQHQIEIYADESPHRLISTLQYAWTPNMKVTWTAQFRGERDGWLRGTDAGTTNIAHSPETSLQNLSLALYERYTPDSDGVSVDPIPSSQGVDGICLRKRSRDLSPESQLKEEAWQLKRQKVDEEASKGYNRLFGIDVKLLDVHKRGLRPPS